MVLGVTLAKAALERYLATSAAAVRAEITGLTPLAGGTLHENWRVDVEFHGGPFAGREALVLRADRPRSIEDSLSRRLEFEVMKTARAAGVTVPEPLWAGAADGPLGREFFFMRWLPGTAAPEEIIHREDLAPLREPLAERLGAELARLQRIRPPCPQLSFLAPPPADRAQALVGATRGYLDTLLHSHPAIEWGLRWLELNAPPAREPVLTHGDYRTGNYVVDAHGLAGILDWELASWGDPLEDLGWFCMRFWRLDAVDLAGGIAPRTALLAGYERESGRRIDAREFYYWEVMANVRWAAISIQQAERHLSGMDKSLELCLTGRRTAELEYEALSLIGASPTRLPSHA